jgi:methyl-accepting chemotaxis protein
MMGFGLLMLVLAGNVGLGVYHSNIAERTVETVTRRGEIQAKVLSALKDINFARMQYWRFAALARDDSWQALQTSIGNAKTDLTTAIAMSQVAERREKLTSLLALVDQYVPQAKRMHDVRLGNASPDSPEFIAATTDINALAAKIFTTADETLALFRAASQQAAMQAAQDSRQSTFYGIVIGILGMTFGVVGMAVISRAIAPPIRAMTGSMSRLAAGDMTITIPATDHQDEIGLMAKALQVFKDNAIDADRLRQTQELARERAEQDKRAALLRMAETVELETRGAVDKVASRTESMSNNAGLMATSAEAVGTNSQSVAAAAQQALANAQNVAAATDELSASIREIGRQVGTASSVTAKAVDTAEDARDIIGRLSEAVGQIGTVAELINDIASQTNLLALNATIEAARAGDAGKGFAVVANEVKNLANQTGHATDEISQQIDEIRETTRRAVDAVSSIASAIRDVEGISSAIAAAIEQQSAATSEISLNVSQTAGAANEVSTRIAHVSGEAHATDQRATEVSGIATEVAEAIELLRSTLIRVVRTATPEVNRRRFPRYRLDRQITVNMGGQKLQAKLGNISEGGALFELDSLGTDQSLRLTIPGLTETLPAKVLATENGFCHVSFDLDDIAAKRFAETVRGLTPLAEAA